VFGAILLAAGAPYIVSNILLVPPESRDLAVNALYLACVTMLMSMISPIPLYVLQGLHRFGSQLLLTNLNGLLLGVGNIVIVLNGHGVLALIAWNLIVVSVVGVLYFLRARQLLPQFHLTSAIDRESLTSVLGYGSSIILYQVSANVLYIFERAWTIRTFGAEALTFYSVPMMLALYMHGFIGSFAVILFPVINELLADREKQVQLYQHTTKIFLALVVFFVGTAVCAGQMGLLLWISEEFAAKSYWLLVIHAFSFGLIAVMIVTWQLSESFNSARLNAFVSAAWTVVTIPLIVLLSGYWNTEGVALARLIAVALTVPMMFYVEHKFLGRVFWRFWLAIVVRVAIAVCMMAATQLWILGHFSPGWLTLASGIGAGGIVFGVVLLATGYLAPAEIQLLRDLLLSRNKTQYAAASRRNH
jgi:O-antigen/teichoic acid export membrane protein